jgi:hypothetical protein
MKSVALRERAMRIPILMPLEIRRNRKFESLHEYANARCRGD